MSSSAATEKKTVILVKQIVSRPLDELEDEERNKYDDELEFGSYYPKTTWSVLTWDGSLEGLSLVSRLHQDHEIAAEEADKEPNRAAKPIGEGDGDGDGDVPASKDDDDKGFRIVGMLPYPPGFGTLTGNTLAFWEDELFFTGGVPFPTPEDRRQRVFSFNARTQQWNTNLPPLHKPRCCHAAIAINASIYVFGDILTCPPEQWISQDFWGERLDLKERETEDWHWHPLPPPSLRTYTYYHPTATAVYRNCPPFTYTTDTNDTHRVEENQNLILLFHNDSHAPISIFNCNTTAWLPDMYPPNSTIAKDFPYCPRHDIYQDRFAILDNVLIWHYFGHYYGYDLVNKEVIQFPFTPVALTGSPAYLFPQGDDKLLILSLTPYNPHSLDYDVFQVQTKKQDHASFQLHYQGYRHISTGDQMVIYDALSL